MTSAPQLEQRLRRMRTWPVFCRVLGAVLRLVLMGCAGRSLFIVPQMGMVMEGYSCDDPPRRLNHPASTAPEILCHTEKIAPGTVAIARFGKADPASDVASPEFCIPISIETAFFLGRSILNRTPTR